MTRLRNIIARLFDIQTGPNPARYLINGYGYYCDDCLITLGPDIVTLHAAPHGVACRQCTRLERIG